MSQTILQLSETAEQLRTWLDRWDDKELEGDERAAVEEFERTVRENLAAKVDEFCAVVREYELTDVAIQAEVDRLRERQGALRRRADKLRQTIKGVVKPGEKVVGTKFSVWTQANGGKAPLDVDEAGVPDEFKYTPAPVVDLERIRSVLESGVSLPFARLGERGTHLRIK